MRRTKRPKKNATDRGVAFVNKEERNSSVFTKEVVNFEAIFGKPGFKSNDLMQAVVESSNMIKALVQVQGNKGAPGVDGLCVEALPKYLLKHWVQIKRDLLEGQYKPSPVRRVEIPKPDGGIRLLGIPTSLDRLIQQAIAQVLSGIFEPTFSDFSYGFRPGRSAHQAITQAQAYVEQGYGFVVDMDLEKFFDRVNHDILMERLSRSVQDKRVLKTIRSYLECGVMVGGLTEPTQEGTPQGGPLSPLLSNVLLDELDRQLEARGHKFCRYADDCNVYVKSRKAGERVKASITKWLAKKLRLKVNEAKSAVDRVNRRQFLSYAMTSVKAPRLKPTVKAVLRLLAKVRALFRKARGRNVERFIKEDLNPLLRGWIEYFKLSQVKKVFETLDGWIRRKLRCVIWRQWKTPRNRFRKMVTCGLSVSHSQVSARNGRGPWWNATQPHLKMAISNKYLDQVGLLNLQQRVMRKAQAG